MTLPVFILEHFIKELNVLRKILRTGKHTQSEENDLYYFTYKEIQGWGTTTEDSVIDFIQKWLERKEDD